MLSKINFSIKTNFSAQLFYSLELNTSQLAPRFRNRVPANLLDLLAISVRYIDFPYTFISRLQVKEKYHIGEIFMGKLIYVFIIFYFSTVYLWCTSVWNYPNILMHGDGPSDETNKPNSYASADTASYKKIPTVHR